MKFILLIWNYLFYGFLTQLGNVNSLVDLNLGVIIKSHDNMSRKVISLAAQIANKNLAKHGYQLKIKTETLDKNKSFYVIRKGCNLLTNGLVGLISPIEAPASLHLSSLASKFHIPHLVTQCRQPDPTGSPSSTFDLRVVPDCDTFSNIIFHFITRIEKWTDMIIIHSRDDTILKFENLINQFEYRLKMRHWIHHDLKNNKQLMKELSSAKHHHHVIVDIPFWQITDFLIMASVHNLTEPLYTFIFTDWDASLIDLAAFKINNRVNITAFSILNQTAVDTLKSQENELDILIKSIINSGKYTRKSDIFHNLLSHPAIIFDSIMVLANGIIKLSQFQPIEVQSLNCESSSYWKTGLSMINAIKSVDTNYGVTGKINFNVYNQRQEYNITIKMLTENGFETAGWWSSDRIIMTGLVTNEEIIDNITYTMPLRVTTVLSKPFVLYKDMSVKQENYDTDPEMWDGYCIDMLKKIGKTLNLNFSIRIVADKTYGIRLDNMTNPDGTEKWNGLIGELLEGKADLAVTSMTISYEREKVVDFTTPYMSLGLSILFKRPKKESPGLFSFLEPLSPPVWGYVIGAYVGVSMILYLISHITPYEWLPSHPCDSTSDKENQFTFLNSLWFAVGALVQQGCEIAPQASSTRVISGVWWFFTLIIISTYTANLAAFLTVERFVMPIKSVEDLANQTDIKYGTIKGGTSQAFFDNALIPTYKKMSKFMRKYPRVYKETADKGVEEVLKANGKYAFLLESPMSDFHRQRDCDLIKVGDPLDSKGYGIGFPPGSKLRDKFTEVILKMQKDQDLDQMRHKWWNEINITEPCEAKKSGGNPAALDVSQVGGVFVLLGVGFVVALMTSILEVYIDYKKKRIKQRIPFGKYLGKELKFAMRFMSSNKKPCKPGPISGHTSGNGGVNSRSAEKLYLIDGYNNNRPGQVNGTSTNVISSRNNGFELQDKSITPNNSANSYRMALSPANQMSGIESHPTNHRSNNNNWVNQYNK